MGKRTCWPQIPKFPEKEILLLQKVASALSLQNVVSLNTRASAPEGKMTVNYPIIKLEKGNQHAYVLLKFPQVCTFKSNAIHLCGRSGCFLMKVWRSESFHCGFMDSSRPALEALTPPSEFSRPVCVGTQKASVLGSHEYRLDLKSAQVWASTEVVLGQEANPQVFWEHSFATVKHPSSLLKCQY